MKNSKNKVYIKTIKDLTIVRSNNTSLLISLHTELANHSDFMAQTVGTDAIAYKNIYDRENFIKAAAKRVNLSVGDIIDMNNKTPYVIVLNKLTKEFEVIRVSKVSSSHEVLTNKFRNVTNAYRIYEELKWRKDIGYFTSEITNEVVSEIIENYLTDLKLNK